MSAFPFSHLNQLIFWTLSLTLSSDRAVQKRKTTLKGCVTFSNIPTKSYYATDILILFGAKRLLWWIFVRTSQKSETYLLYFDVDGIDVKWRALSLMFIGIILGVVDESISGPEIGFNSDMSKTGTSKHVNSGGAACFSQLISHH